VGETGNPLKKRLNYHRSDIRLKKPTTIAIHFNSEGHTYENLQIIPIEICDTNNNTPEYRRRREIHWQNALGTIHPQGLNNYPIDKKAPDLYLKNNKPPPPKKLIPVILPFNSLSTKLFQLWRGICSSDSTLQNCRFVAAYKNSKNIKSKLVRSKL